MSTMEVLCENGLRLKTFNCFLKKSPLQIFGWARVNCLRNYNSILQLQMLTELQRYGITILYESLLQTSKASSSKVIIDHKFQ